MFYRLFVIYDAVLSQFRIFSSLYSTYFMQETGRMSSGKAKSKTPSYVYNGSYGCVFSPQVSCENELDSVNGKVSKVFRGKLGKEVADDEWAEQEKVEQIDQEGKFTVRKLSKCDIHSSSFPMDELSKCSNFKGPIGKTLSQIVYEFGGQNLSDIHKKNVSFAELFIALEPVMAGIAGLQWIDSAHCDIKPDNLLYNEKTKKASLIDFGLLNSYQKIFSNDNVHILNHTYRFYPPEFKFCGYLYKNHGKVIPSTVINGNLLARMTADYNEFYNDFVSVQDESELKNYIASIFHPTTIEQECLNFLKTLALGKDNRIEDIESRLVPNASNKLDVYMFGISIFEIFLNYCSQKKIDSLSYYKELLSLIYGMTRANPYQRYTLEEAIDHYRIVVGLIQRSPASSMNIRSRSTTNANRVSRKDTHQESPMKWLRGPSGRLARKGGSASSNQAKASKKTDIDYKGGSTLPASHKVEAIKKIITDLEGGRRVLPSRYISIPLDEFVGYFGEGHIDELKSWTVRATVQKEIWHDDREIVALIDNIVHDIGKGYRKLRLWSGLQISKGGSVPVKDYVLHNSRRYVVRKDLNSKKFISVLGKTVYLTDIKGKYKPM